nr:AraC family transcriptional regulator [Paludisphaera mucosa]
MFDCLDDVVVWVKDREGRYRWVNRAFLLNHAFGVGAAEAGPHAREVVGKTDYEVSPPFLADQFRMDDEYVLGGRRIVDRIELVGQPDGRTVWSMTNKIPLYDGRGEVVATAGLTRKLAEPDAAVATLSGLGPVLAFLRDHFAEPITNARLAAIAHMSVRAFERRFQDELHTTPQKYLRRLRIRLAARALVTTRQSLAEIAAACGFADQSHFTREFGRWFGRTPREYRAHYSRRDGPVPNAGVEAQDP